MSHIEPCPNCGRLPKMFKQSSQPVYMLQCEKEYCGMKTYGVSKERAIARWNDLADEKARDIGKHREWGWERV